jgi:SAM-dependent methyltransferase
LLAKLSKTFLSLLGNRNQAPGRLPASADPVDCMIPDYSIAEYVGSGGGAEQYKAIGRMQVDWLRQHAELQPDDDVLEVGCGIGRIAAPLTQYLQGGTYRGFDIVPHGIDWCQAQITPRYPNFRFFVSDIYNKAYNPNGRHRASEYSFPFENASFDVVFLTSVFTHMLTDDVEHYTAEIGRVLRPGGRCYCTAYLMTEDARRFMDERQSFRIFRPMEDARAWTDSPDVPEAAIGYSDTHLFAVFSKAGMEVRKVIPGEWWKNQYAQDVLAAYKQ